MQALVGKFIRSKPTPPAPQPTGTSTLKMENTDLVKGREIFFQYPLNIELCENYLQRLLSELNNGYKFATAENTSEIFIAITSALKSKDLTLHRLILLLMRILHVPSDISFMAVQSLSDELSSSITQSKAVALRTIPYIIPQDMIKNMNNSIANAIASREQIVLSAFCFYGMSLVKMGNADVIQKFSPDIRNATEARSITQYHALLLTYLLKKGDGQSLKQIINTMNRNACFSSLSSHVLIQAALEASNLLNDPKPLEFIKSKLQETNIITQLDAVRAILASPLSPVDLVSSAVTRLNSILSSPSRISSFAALRTIKQYAQLRREDFAICNNVLERMLNDSNKTISTLAAMSLLHTGFESTIDRVLPTVGEFAPKLPIDQKISLMKSCIDLGKRVPTKAVQILQFIWKTFRYQDIFELQRIFVDGLFAYFDMKDIKKSDVLHFLIEYIEDSKFSEISIDIINFITKRSGDVESNHREIIRVFCNRLNLDSLDVRSALIDALSTFAFEEKCKDAKEVRRIIASYMKDQDEEIRDRAVFYTTEFERNNTEIMSPPKLDKKEFTHIQFIQNYLDEIQQPAIIEQIEDKKQQIEEIEIDPIDEQIDEFLGENHHISDKLIGFDSDIVVEYEIHSNDDCMFALKFFVKNTLDTEINSFKINIESEEKLYESSEIEEILPDQTQTCYVTFDDPVFVKSILRASVYFIETGDNEFGFDNDIVLVPEIYKEIEKKRSEIYNSLHNLGERPRYLIGISSSKNASIEENLKLIGIFFNMVYVGTNNDEYLFASLEGNILLMNSIKIKSSSSTLMLYFEVRCGKYPPNDDEEDDTDYIATINEYIGQFPKARRQTK